MCADLREVERALVKAYHGANAYRDGLEALRNILGRYRKGELYETACEALAALDAALTPTDAIADAWSRALDDAARR